MTFKACVLAAMIACGAAGTAMADDAPDFVPGRPGKNESPIVVPKGYFQIETEAALVGLDRESGVKTRSLSIGASSLRYGLGDGYEAELLFQPYARQRVRDSSGKSTTSGIGDTVLRVRKGLTGQNGEPFAAAVIAYVTLPTAKEGLGSENVGGGVFLPLQQKLTNKLSLAATLGLGLTDSAHKNRDVLLPSAALGLGYSFTDSVSGFVEVYAEKAAEEGAKADSSFDFGLTLLAAPTLQLDAGVNLGLSDEATDSEFYVGVAKRF